MDRTAIKESAKQQIKGKLAILFLITLIINAITCFVGVILRLFPIVGPFITPIILIPAFTLSIVQIYMGVAKGIKPEVIEAFAGFDDFWGAFKVSLLTALLTFLWSLLFIIPGIIKSYSYSMAMFIFADDTSKSALECINESKAMTDGYKLDLFVLELSFIGWAILGVFTLGILYIWLIPYASTSYAIAYDVLKSKAAMGAPADSAPSVEAPDEMKPHNLLAVISKQFLIEHNVTRCKFKKISEMSDGEIISCCHRYYEDNNLTNEWKVFREEFESNYYYCGFTAEYVDPGYCYDLQMISLDAIKPSILPELVINKEELKKCCSKCEHCL